MIWRGALVIRKEETQVISNRTRMFSILFSRNITLFVNRNTNYAADMMESSVPSPVLYVF